jgi:hypothetical protein
MTGRRLIIVFFSSYRTEQLFSKVVEHLPRVFSSIFAGNQVLNAQCLLTMQAEEEHVV